MNFKKIISAVIASATLLAGTAFPVSADYDPCDVDRNGYVNIGDLVYLNKYLLGGYSVTNYNQLDVNRSLTVDDADRKCLTTILLGEDSFSWGYYSRKKGNVLSKPTVSGFTPSDSSSSTAKRTYRRCGYDENGRPTEVSEYSLTPTVMTLNGGASPRAIIGDDRYTADGPEISGFVSVNCGTGFIVGDHEIATAAHCVNSRGAWLPLVISTFDSNGCITDNALHPVEVHIPKSFKSADGTGENTMHDYALITVSEDLSDRVHFSLGTPYNVSKSAYSNIPVYLTGSPSDLSEESGITRLFSAEGRVIDKINNLYDDSDVLCFDIDSTNGQSGSPIYTITKIGSEYVYTAISILSGGFVPDGPNVGSMITNYHIQFYKNNPYASYS